MSCSYCSETRTVPVLRICRHTPACRLQQPVKEPIGSLADAQAPFSRAGGCEHCHVWLTLTFPMRHSCFDVERAVGAYPAPHGPAATAGGAPAAATSPDIACATSTTAWATLSEGGLGRRRSLR